MVNRTSATKTKITEVTADGFLIAEYFRMKQQGLTHKVRIQEASIKKWI